MSFVGSYSCWILSKKIVFPREIERESTSLVSRKYQCLKIVRCLFYLFTCRYLNIFICQIIRDLLKVWMVLPQDMLSENVSPIVGFWALGARVRPIQRVNIYIIDEEDINLHLCTSYKIYKRTYLTFKCLLEWSSMLALTVNL